MALWTTLPRLYPVTVRNPKPYPRGATVYLSSLRIRNWRSYEDATLAFEPPQGQTPLVLIGGMNGHGKTSFLYAMYLGLFGAHGLPFTEGFRKEGDELRYYRQAMARFRRASSDPDEPTSIEIELAPGPRDGDLKKLRICRRWYFTSAGELKSGTTGEEVEIHVNERPLRLGAHALTEARDYLNKHFLDCPLLSAFIFDGEQAQQVIHSSTERALQRTVEVMYGTQLVGELEERMRNFGNRLMPSGGRSHIEELKRRAAQKQQEQEDLKGRLHAVTEELHEVDRRKRWLEQEREDTRLLLARLGGDRSDEVATLQRELQQVEREHGRLQKQAEEFAGRLGGLLGLSRLYTPIEQQLKAEQIREQWETLREGARVRADDIVRRALPDPLPPADPLYHFRVDTVDALRERFRTAIADTFMPRPEGCADFYRLGHVRGDARGRLMQRLQDLRQVSNRNIVESARRLRQVRVQQEELTQRFSRLASIPADTAQLAKKLEELNAEIGSFTRELGTKEKELASLQQTLTGVEQELGRVRSELLALQPDEARVVLARRVADTLKQFQSKLTPLIHRQLEVALTEQFVHLLDKRFQGATVKLPRDGSPPQLQWQGGRPQEIQGMSGFGRRAFGIAYSIALTQLTRRRLPMIIDTPLGNADSEYRERLLKCLRDVELDQVILLAHDNEIPVHLYDKMKQDFSQTFTLEFDRRLRQTRVYPGRYFDRK